MSYPGWDGAWLFQFKHYRFDASGAQRRILKDLEQGVRDARQRYLGLKNYILVTSVPFTGVPQRGSFDRVNSKLEELQSETGLRIDVWDGLEVASQVALHRAAFEVVAPDRAKEVGEADIQRFRMPAKILRGFTDEMFERHVMLLIGGYGDPLGPDSGTPVSNAIYAADFPALQEVVRTVVGELSRRAKERALQPDLAYWFDWLMLALALADVRTGAVRAAIRRTLGLLRRLAGPAERAWAYNILSLGYGKLENHSRYVAATKLAVACAEEADNYWLAATVKMRALHKIDWAAGEAGAARSDQEFIDSLLSVAEAATDRRLREPQKAHARGQQHVYTALHHRWSDRNAGRAETALKAAAAFFAEAGDRSELTRIRAEEGHLAQRAGSPAEASLSLLKKAFTRRLAAGEVARARYDLLYLAQLYVEEGSLLEAEVCATLALSLHRRLYGDRRVDTRLVYKLSQTVRGCGLRLHRRILGERVRSDLLLEIIIRATGLSELDVLRSVDVPALLNDMRLNLLRPEFS